MIRDQNNLIMRLIVLVYETVIKFEVKKLNGLCLNCALSGNNFM